MMQLMKYEWRKGMFTKMVLLFITALVECFYLVGVFMKKDNLYITGASLLAACAIFGIIFIGVESLLTFSKDLNTKQSYMLFLTPHTSYEILGAKVLNNGISILTAGACFAALAILDIFIGISYIGNVKMFLEIFESFMKVDIDWDSMIHVGLIAFTAILVQWLFTIVVGYLSILLSATVLAGKKLSGFVSFLIFVVINGVVVWLVNITLDSFTGEAQYWFEIGLLAVLTVIFYWFTGWFMEKKLSV